MPSKLPVIKANTSQVNISKMGVIAKAHKRSVSKELEFLIENHIREYERENGTILLSADATATEVSEFVSQREPQ